MQSLLLARRKSVVRNTSDGSENESPVVGTDLLASYLVPGDKNSPGQVQPVNPGFVLQLDSDFF